MSNNADYYDEDSFDGEDEFSDSYLEGEDDLDGLDEDYTPPELGYTIYSNKAMDIYLRSGEVLSINDEHPNFHRLRELLVADAQAVTDEEVTHFCNFGFYIGAELESLSDRVRFDGENVFFDGDIIQDTLTEQIIRMAKERNPKLGSLVKFLENVAMNPSEESRSALYSWISNLQKVNEKLTITRDGKLLAYKGVKIGQDNVSYSIRSGPGIIDGLSMNGNHPLREDSVIEVPRSYVEADNTKPCGPGLHAGTWSYAKSWSMGRVLEVEIHPRDIVSVPVDTGCQKIRSCRYTVISETDTVNERAVFTASWTEADYEMWLDEGYSDEDAQQFIHHGYSFEEALDEMSDKSDFNDYELGEDGDYHRNAEVEEDDSEKSVEEVLSDWAHAGFNRKDAQEWLNLGYSLEEAIREHEATHCPLDDCSEAEEDADSEDVVTREAYVVDNLVDAFTTPKSKSGKKKKKGKKNKK